MISNDGLTPAHLGVVLRLYGDRMLDGFHRLLQENENDFNVICTIQIRAKFLPHFSIVFRTNSADGSLRSYAQPSLANAWIQNVVMLNRCANSAAL